MNFIAHDPAFDILDAVGGRLEGGTAGAEHVVLLDAAGQPVVQPWTLGILQVSTFQLTSKVLLCHTNH